MEALSQFDVSNPDHISVITRDGKVTVSVLKDGTSVTLGFPIKNSVFDTTPRPPLQQPAPQDMAVRDAQIRAKYEKEAGLAFLEKMAAEDQAKIKVLTKKTRYSPVGNPKLDEEKVISIKHLLADKQVMNSFRSKQQAYEMIGSKFNVSCHTIHNIHKGLAWRHVKI